VSAARAGLVLAALALAGTLPSCGPCSRTGDGSGSAAARDGRPAVVGMALDARNGEPLGGVRIEGPDGARTVSKQNGRFALEGLAPGIRARITGSLEDGRRAERSVGPLGQGQRLEIVLRLAAPKE
jgi:hypothetical protein